MLPLVHRFEIPPSVVVALRAFAKLPKVCLLESAKILPELGRYSFLMADPFMDLVCEKRCHNPLDETSAALRMFRSETVSGLPPFQGGASGLLSYELGGCFEKIAPARYDDFPIPLLALGLYDVVLAWDHKTNEAWLISQGWPEQDPAARKQRAEQRLQMFLSILETAQYESPLGVSHDSLSVAFDCNRSPSELTAKQSPVFENHFEGKWQGNFSSSEYRKAVAKAIEYIHAGDIFQVNLSQRWIYPACCESLDLYCELREVNPAPFAAYMDLGTTQLLSASPERFLKMQNRLVETRPIKGTRQRSENPVVDLLVGDSLTESRKDRAENMMIVDLLRNDLSRVCESDSIRVTQLCHVERYQYVLHLVSAVEGKLSDKLQPLDLIRATFPGGSITGAPKVRAMEIIAELEPTRRGAYCGSLGYIGFDGAMDWNIAIRTITAASGWWQVQAGGGVVADSQPIAEEAETWHKAEGLVRAIESMQRKVGCT